MAVDQSRLMKTLFLSSLAAAVLVLAALIVAVLLLPAEHARAVLLDISLPVINLAATVTLFLAAKTSKAHALRLGLARRVWLAWLILAAAQLAYTLGDLTWAVLEIGLGQQPFPSLADGFYLAYYPMFLAGILLLPSQSLERSEFLKVLLDMGMILLAAGLGIWNYLLGPLVQAGAGEPLAAQILSLAYPAGDVILVAAVLLLVYRKTEGHLKGPMLALALGALTGLVTDCIYSYQSISGTYASGGFVDLAYLATYLIFFMAGISQIVTVRHGPLVELKAISSSLAVRGLNLAVPYLPYAWLLWAYVLLTQSYNRRAPLDITWMGVGVAGIIGIVLVRQMIAFFENHRLVKQLNGALDQVKKQSDELSQTNSELQNEIEERLQAEKKLAFNALHDPLTGLPNRALFMDRLEHVIEVTRRHAEATYSVLYLDLDQFKVINDSLGHSAGDQLLIAIAQRLRLCLRLSDTISRLGGDEFVILLEDTSQSEDVLACARRIIERLSAPFNLQDRQMFVSTSLGIVLDVKGYERPEEVVRDADIAMYHAKAMGKARYEIFEPGLRQQVITRLELENDLRHALERDEFILNYQPIISLKPGKITGFEALIRWRHPERGVILPMEFIPLAEETGLIIPIGRWVLQQACRTMREWQVRYPKNPPLTLSVNISGRQLQQPGFVQEVGEVLEESGLDGHSLRLEITEGVCLHSDKAAIEIFLELAEMGIQFQIDDFGVGYSSLSYLQYFPIRTIKIDRAFVSKIGVSNHTDLVRTIISLAHDLGMDTIAEGVETRDQLSSLEDSGCNSVQGYLFSRPVDDEGVARLLEQSRIDPVRRARRIPLARPQPAG